MGTGTKRPARGRRWAAGMVAGLIVAGAAVSACTNSSQNSGAMAGDMATVAAGSSDAAAAATTAAGGEPRAVESGAAGAQAPGADAPSSAAAGSASAADGTSGAASAESSGGSGSGSGGKDAKTSDPEPPAAMQGRQIIRTGSFAVELTVPKTKDDDADQKALRQKVSDAAIKARAAGTGVGGYVSASEGERTTVSVTLRVPVSKYDAARQALAGIGELTGTESSEDVTGALADLDGRIATMKAAVDRLRQLLAKATKISDIIAIESELSSREGDLEAIMRKRAAMADQVALSTITLVITGRVVDAKATQQQAVIPVPQLGSAGPSGFVGGVIGAFDVLKGIGSGILVVIGAVLPFLPILVVLALLIPWFRRRFGDLRVGRTVQQPSLRPELRGDR